MYWRYRINVTYGFALKDVNEDPSIPVDMVDCTLEDFFVVKTYVEFGKLKDETKEADKV